MQTMKTNTLSDLDRTATRLSCCVSSFEIIRGAVEFPEHVDNQFLDALSAVLFQLEDISRELIVQVDQAVAENRMAG